MRIRKIISSLLVLLFAMMLLPGMHVQTAAKDKKAPKAIVSYNTQSYTKDDVKVTIDASDSSKIAAVKWASGAKKTEYFKKNGTKIKIDKKQKVTADFTVTKNGVYTIYVKDGANNTKKIKIDVNWIDKSAPVVETVVLEEENTSGKTATVQVTAADDLSGVKEAFYLAGADKKASTVIKNGTKIALTELGQGTFAVDQNGDYTVAVRDHVGNVITETVQVTTIDKTAPTLDASYTVMNQQATVSVDAEDKDSGIKGIWYIKGSYAAEDEIWEKTANIISDDEFIVSAAGNYTIMVEDMAGNRSVIVLYVETEFKAVWISFLEFEKSKEYSEKEFKRFVDEMFDNCKDMKMNAVIVQVRPMGDAMYPSKYFPWSVYASGKQGKNPGYDPVEYMVEAAHSRNLEFHAWINPYRVTSSGTKASSLAEDNQARIWMEDESTERYVLSYSNKLFYNPSIPEVQDLIINGVREIVKNYDVDGIHFDDYFYPNLGSKYKSNFDATEYKAYKKDCEASGIKADTIVNWRRNNVSTLVKNVKKAVKKINPDCRFGISPAGNISNLKSVSSYYVDIEKWLSSNQYVDYICPQIYWTFDHPTAPYKTILQNWMDIKKSNQVNLYVGLAVYRAGSSESAAKQYGDIAWSQNSNILKKQVQYGRKSGMVDGYMFFRYESMIGSQAKKEMNNLLTLFK